MYKFVVCVDPDTCIYYSINLTNFELHIEEIKSSQMRQLVKEKARKACQQVKQVVSWNTFNKVESQEVWRYRRRVLPTYLLHESKQKLPAYIIEEPMPPSLSEELEEEDEKGQSARRYRADIEVQVNMEQYYTQLRQKYSEHTKIPAVFKCKFKLVTSVNEVLKIIYKSAIQQRDIELTPNNPKNKLVLRVHATQDYLYGHTPLMNYLYIRKCLRNKQPAKLILTQQFMEEHSQLRKTIVYREITEVDLGTYKQLEWDILLKEEPLLWYPPFPLTPQTIKELKQRQQLRSQYDDQKEKVAQARKDNPFYQSDQMENIRVKLRLLRQPKPQKPRFMLKEQAVKLSEMRKIQVERRVIEIGSNICYSGQCESSFQMKVVSISNLLKVFMFHSKYNTNINYEQKNIAFTSHADYNSMVFINLKRLQMMPFIPYGVVVRTRLTYTDRVLFDSYSQPVAISGSPRIDHLIQWKQLSMMPLQTKIFFSVILLEKGSTINNGFEVGIAGISLFDDRGHLRQGTLDVLLWPFKTLDLRIAGCVNKFNEILPNKSDYTKISVTFPKFTNEVQWSLRSDELIRILGYHQFQPINKTPTAEDSKDLAKLDNLLRYDPLKMLQYTDKEKQLLQSCKPHYSRLPDKYINYLYSIDWAEPEQVKKAIKSRQEWQPLRPVHCLPLLSQRIGDEAIRFYAVERMTSMTDDQIVLYMLQLVQALTVESIHHNPLSEFLLERSVMSPHRVGHSFFWQLRSQLSKPFEFERYALYLESLMMLSKHRKDFCEQLKVNKVLTQTAATVVKEEATNELKNTFFKNKLLPKLKGQLPSPFVLAINPEKKNDDFLESQCKVFDSKKVPLLLTLVEDPLLHRKDQSPTKKSGTYRSAQRIILQRVIFKSGDDIRQDQLTLQILKIMDNIWLEAGYDFKMSIYRVLPVDDMIGYIQVVENAENNSSIHTVYGGSMGALSNKTFELYLRQHNPTRQEYRNAKDNFTRSNVGYLVASYVLGLGDRHSGNAMITKNGMFFHIDFGHFLGNFKEKLKIKRERSPFLFTSEFVHVIGGRESKAFQQFEQLCGVAYNLIRKNANMIIDMFAMMVAAGIPQLYHYRNIDYLVDKLSLSLSAQQAAAKIKQQIKDTLDSETSRRLDNLVHQIKRNG